MVTKELIEKWIPGVYAAGEVQLGGKQYCCFSSESVLGRVLLLDEESGKVYELSDNPGGIMGFSDIPDDDAFLCVEEFYPVFFAKDAKIKKIHVCFNEDGTVSCRRETLAQIPYGHRMMLVHEQDGDYIVVGTLADEKEYQDDWSHPGSVWAGKYEPEASHVELEKIYTGIYKNHAMYKKKNAEGYDDVYIGGTDGTFLFTKNGEEWNMIKVHDEPASDIVVFDFDDDGQDELAIIKEFHGDTAIIYKDNGNGFEPALSIPSGFGHVLWGGYLNGKPVLVFGNRSGRKNLSVYLTAPGENGGITAEEIVVDEGQAPAQAVIKETPEGLTIYTTNNGAAQVVKYQVYPD